MTISRTFWIKFLSAILIVLLLLEAIDSRPAHKKAKRKHHPKQCGKTGHLCQPGSRKLCCAVGYTCQVPDVTTNFTKRQKRKRKLGTCQSILPLSASGREMDEKQPANPSFWL